MLIQINDEFFNQESIKRIYFTNDTNGACDKVFMWIDFINGDITRPNNAFITNEIIYLRNKTSEEQYKTKKSLVSFLGRFFGKVGIKLTLNNPYEIGMDVYDWFGF